MSCRNIEIKGIGNCAIREYVVSGLNVTSGGQTVILEKTVLRSIRVSAALLSEIMAYPASGADKNPQALMRFARALQDNGPMFSTVFHHQEDRHGVEVSETHDGRSPYPRSRHPPGTL